DLITAEHQKQRQFSIQTSLVHLAPEKAHLMLKTQLDIKKHISGIIAFVFAAILLSGAGLGNALAAPSFCPEHYFEGNRPNVTNPKLAKSATELCSSGHAVMYSGIARSPIWSAEHLSPGRIMAAAKVPRSDNFAEDTRLPKDWRNELEDFRGSGFD